MLKLTNALVRPACGVPRQGAIARSRRTAAAQVAACVALSAALVSCASAWRLEARPAELSGDVPLIAPCEAVADAVIGGPTGDLAAVAYLSRPRDGQVRVHLGTDSGLTILDVEVEGAATRIHAQSALGGRPGFADVVAADLRRLLGDRSVFAATGRTGRRVLEDGPERVALGLPDGSWAVVPAGGLRTGWTTLRVTLLGPGRVPEADIVYDDPGPGGLPRTLRLTDFDDGHTLSLDVQQVTTPVTRSSP